ncbi:hypothetical protein ASE21_19390 [Flavobacterium sp. Root901]|uniref:caspase family protein n=1 Tax=Flavobacterium sp. Root901 TaxID=1736605 RepID=UPI00070FFB33|nr:caspase family protein [Flavobacterium sp. Root901]KRD06336.1 hypothetical protein ASE21_19390 [Flavobacterium sp. Root901]
MKVLAIVVGNNKYFEGCELDNAINDAQGIADIFSRLGYEVLFWNDINTDGIIEILEQYEKRINEFDASIFYFAGHGFQVDGENYLASVDCQIANPTKAHCQRTCIRLTEIMDIFRKASTMVNIAIIDACRKGFERGGSSEFSPIHAPKGALIAFSTSENSGAKDYGYKNHSIYTGSLLKFIGVERLSVEELFKRVRKTVFALTGGAQTTWEHTSLVGDFYFNTGQLVHSITIPYSEVVVKDKMFSEANDQFGIVMNLKSYDWNIQNPAIDRFLSIPPSKIDKDQQFIIGRNILQAADYAFNATAFLDNLRENLRLYTVEGENHLLNGILYEIYFNSNGDFRSENLKKHNLPKVLKLRNVPEFKKSFEFITKVLEPYRDQLFYIPGDNVSHIDVAVLATNEVKRSKTGEEFPYQAVDTITVQGKDITLPISKYDVWGTNESNLKQVISHYLSAPEELIQINSGVELKKMTFKIPEETSTW